jgi:hypothetical protein
MNSFQMLKYGVVRMHDLVQDVLHWERFYLCGRLQKPVRLVCYFILIFSSLFCGYSCCLLNFFSEPYWIGYIELFSL